MVTRLPRVVDCAHEGRASTPCSVIRGDAVLLTTCGEYSNPYAGCQRLRPFDSFWVSGGLPFLRAMQGSRSFVQRASLAPHTHEPFGQTFWQRLYVSLTWFLLVRRLARPIRGTDWCQRIQTTSHVGNPQLDSLIQRTRCTALPHDEQGLEPW